MDLEKQNADVETKRKKALADVKTMEDKLNEHENRVRAIKQLYRTVDTLNINTNAINLLWIVCNSKRDVANFLLSLRPMNRAYKFEVKETNEKKNIRVV